MANARLSDDAVLKRTGRNWKQWFEILDRAGAKKMSHKEMVEHLYEKHHVSSWWCQMIAVSYERERGMREVHQTTGGYAVSVSRTFEVPIGVLYCYWSDAELRSRWLKEKFVIRRQTKNKSIRITWADGKTSVEVYFNPKGRSKSQVSVQHNKLANSKQIEPTRSFWKKALDRLSDSTN